MASLPENWESDYDGDRWFFRFRPTGLVQYTFPKPGDEYPEFVDVFSPPPELSPEEKLESHYQVKRRNTAGGSGSASQTSKSRDGLTSATMAGPGNDGGDFWYQPDGLMYMGPGGYTDISPEEEDEAESGAGFKHHENKDPQTQDTVEPPPPGAASKQLEPDRSSYISPVISAETTPLASNSHPATSPLLKNTVAVADVGDAGRTDSGGAESPDGVPLLDGRQIQSPVGYMAELASELTAQCREETHPAPVELPTHDMTTEAALQPLVYANAFDMDPVELPAHQSPVSRHAHNAGIDQKVLIPSPLQDPPQTCQTPARQSSMPLPTAEPSQSFTVPARPTPAKYQAYKPGRHVAAEGEGRVSPSVNPDAKRYSLAGAMPVPPREHVPAVLQPPQVPPKQPLGRDDKDSYMLPGSSARHESISDYVRPRLVPSVLQPAGGRAASSVPRPSLQDHRARSTPAYQPYNPYRDLEEHIESTAQLYSQPLNNREPNTTSVPRASAMQAPLDARPVVNTSRANTLPLDMPALPYMGIDPSHRAPPPALQTRPESPLRPAYRLPGVSNSSAQQSSITVLDEYSCPKIKGPDFPEPLKSYDKQPPDRKTRIQSLDSAAGNATPTPTLTTTRRVSLSNPSHGFIVQNSAMPPPSTQSLRNDSAGTGSSSEPRPATRSVQSSSHSPLKNGMKDPRVQAQVPPAFHGQLVPQQPTPTPESQFHRREQGLGPGGRPAPGRPHSVGQRDTDMPTIGSNVVPPRGQVGQATSNQSSAAQTRHSSAVAQGGARPVPRPVSVLLQPQEASRPLHTRPVTVERAERLPTPQPVPLPTPPTPPQTCVHPGGTQSTSQPHRIPLPVPVPQPSPVPRPSRPSSSHPAVMKQAILVVPDRTAAWHGVHPGQPPIHPTMTQQGGFVQQAGVLPHSLGGPQPFTHVIPQEAGGRGALQAMYFPPGGIPQQASLPQVAAGALPMPVVSQPHASPGRAPMNRATQHSDPPVCLAQNTGAEAEKETWFGNVFKSGSVKKQNPVAGIAPASTGGRSTPDSTARNVLQKSQLTTVQMGPAQGRPNTSTDGGASATTPAPTPAPASKWDSSGYDGSGWGDDDEDEYDYDGGYGRGGYGDGYR